MKIGDKVKFGAYGDFSDSKHCTIVGIKNSPLMGGKVYTLQGESGNEFDAYIDEIIKV